MGAFHLGLTWIVCLAVIIMAEAMRVAWQESFENKSGNLKLMDILSFMMEPGNPKALAIARSKNIIMFLTQGGGTEKIFLAGRHARILQFAIQKVGNFQEFEVVGNDLLRTLSSWSVLFFGKEDDPFLKSINEHIVPQLSIRTTKLYNEVQNRLLYFYPFITDKNIFTADVLPRYHSMLPKNVTVLQVEDVIYAPKDHNISSPVCDDIISIMSDNDKAVVTFYEAFIDFHPCILKRLGLYRTKKILPRGMEAFSSESPDSIHIRINKETGARVTRWTRGIFKEVTLPKVEALSVARPGDHVLLENQSVAFANGIYTVISLSDTQIIMQTSIWISGTVTSRAQGASEHQEIIVLKSDAPLPAFISIDIVVYISQLDMSGTVTELMDDGAMVITIFDDVSYGEKKNFCMSNMLHQRREECLAPYTPSGARKSKQDVWDRPCLADEDCPFFDGNHRGGCDQGVCEMPIGINRLGYRKWQEAGAPICLHRDENEEVCTKYAFWGDFMERHVNNQ